MRRFILAMVAMLVAGSAFGQGAAGAFDINGNPYATENYANVEIDSYSNVLDSTTAGSEGIRYIGALGGYDLEEFMEDTGIKGLSRDKMTFSFSVAPVSDLEVTWTGGDVYHPDYDYYHVAAGTNTLTDNAVNWAYWDSGSPQVIQWTTGARPYTTNRIIIARFSASFGWIVNSMLEEATGDLLLGMDHGHSQALPSLITGEGLLVSATGSALSNIAMTAGTEFQDIETILTHDARDLSDFPSTLGLLLYHHTNSGNYGWTLTNQFPVGLYDNGTNLVPTTTNLFYRGVFVSMEGSLHMHYVMPTQSATSLVEAASQADPTLPNGWEPYIPRVMAYVYIGSNTTLTTTAGHWIDRRFRIIRGAGGTATIGSSASATPSLSEVLAVGAGTGGILPDGMGNPANADEAANKGYVDQEDTVVSNAAIAYADAATSGIYEAGVTYTDAATSGIYEAGVTYTDAATNTLGGRIDANVADITAVSNLVIATSNAIPTDAEITNTVFGSDIWSNHIITATQTTCVVLYMDTDPDVTGTLLDYPGDTNFTTVTNWAGDLVSEGFNTDATNGQITVLRSGKYWSFFSFGAESAGCEGVFGIFKNGVSQSIATTRKMGGGDVGSMSAGGYVQASSGDVFTVQARWFNNNKDVFIHKGQFAMGMAGEGGGGAGDLSPTSWETNYPAVVGVATATWTPAEPIALWINFTTPSTPATGDYLIDVMYYTAYSGNTAALAQARASHAFGATTSVISGVASGPEIELGRGLGAVCFGAELTGLGASETHNVWLQGRNKAGATGTAWFSNITLRVTGPLKVGE